MPDYFLREHFAAKLGVTEVELAQFEAEGLLRPVIKNGRAYISSRDLYRLKAVLHFMRRDGLSLQEARRRLQELSHRALSFSGVSDRA
jgi:DNA-binding transcriptional MerR regulator